jgi:hypothetical protein
MWLAESSYSKFLLPVNAELSSRLVLAIDVLDSPVLITCHDPSTPKVCRFV